MVLLLKQWKSRSSPGFAGGARKVPIHDVFKAAGGEKLAAALLFQAQRCAADVGAGWSSPVARQAHNLKVAGSNPAPATNKASPLSSGLFCCLGECRGPSSSVVICSLAVIGDVEALPLGIASVAQADE